MQGLTFSDYCGDFTFYVNNTDPELWRETPKPGRLFLIESGERICCDYGLGDNGVGVTFEQIVELKNQITEVVYSRTKNIDQDAVHMRGKMIFWDEDLHNTVVLLVWENKQFELLIK